jgi:hypothetical protein
VKPTFDIGASSPSLESIEGYSLSVDKNFLQFSTNDGQSVLNITVTKIIKIIKQQWF